MSRVANDAMQLPSLDDEEDEILDYDEDDGLIVEEPSSSRSIGPMMPSVASSSDLPGVDDPVSIGPCMPPGFPRRPSTDDEAYPDDPNAHRQDASLPHVASPIGPSLPAPLSACIGPSLPASIGPSLPPHLQRPHRHSTPQLPTVADPSSDPPEPRHIGPAIPHELLPNGDGEEHEEEEEEFFGPLPPGPAEEPSSSRVGGVGPALPPGMVFPSTVDVPGDDEEEDDDDGVIGPLPPGVVSAEQAEYEYLLRLKAIKDEQEREKNTVRREEWMTSVPKKMGNFGLGARTFQKASGAAPATADSHREWTETPAEKKRRLEKSGGVDEPCSSLAVDPEQAAIRERDAHQAHMAQQLAKSRGEALMDQHVKKRKTDAEQPPGDDGQPGGRVAFNIERDMAVSGLRGNASAEEIKKRCGQLSSRFGSSNKQKYL